MLNATISPGRPWARFDDLLTGSSLLCPAPDRVLVAARPEDVIGVLTEVQQATDRGRWAYGYVSYEAAAEHAEVQGKTAVLHARPVAFQLLETMRYDGGLIRNRDRHLQRMADSADHLVFRFDLSATVETLDTRLGGVGPGLARVRLLLDRDGTIDVGVGPVPPAANAVLLALDDDPVDSTLWWLFHKTTLREPYEIRRARRPDADDVIMINTDGQLTEVTTATLAVKLDDHWWTPPLSSGCLPGIERARLIDARQLGERVLYPTDLQSAQALAVLNSLRGWRPARRHDIDARPACDGVLADLPDLGPGP